MIISPPFLRDKDATQSEADWIEAMMPVNARHILSMHQTPGMGASIYHIRMQAQHRKK